MSKEIDLVNRDPNDMNNFLQVDFEDVLAEPSGAHAMDCAWSNSYKCFTCGKNLCYKLMTCLCGMCIALYWGCAFAEIAFYVIWIVTPGLRAMHIMLHPVKKIMQIMLSTFVGPWAETVGLLFSRIHVTNSQGPPPKPLGLIDGDEKQVR